MGDDYLIEKTLDSPTPTGWPGHIRVINGKWTLPFGAKRPIDPFPCHADDVTPSRVAKKVVSSIVSPCQPRGRVNCTVSRSLGFGRVLKPMGGSDETGTGNTVTGCIRGFNYTHLVHLRLGKKNEVITSLRLSTIG